MQSVKELQLLKYQFIVDSFVNVFKQKWYQYLAFLWQKTSVIIFQNFALLFEFATLGV